MCRLGPLPCIGGTKDPSPVLHKMRLSMHVPVLEVSVQVFVGVLIALHGLITLAIGGAAVGGAPTPPEMGRLPGAGWYPVPMGESWLLRGGAAAQMGGVLWVLAGFGLLVTAASVFGFIMPGAWRQAALISGTLGLAGIALFFHPYYVIAVAANLALIAAATVLEPTARRVLGI